jgi:hypothetical protein
MQVAAEQTGGDQRPFGVSGALVLVGLLYRTDLLAVAAEQVAALRCVRVCYWVIKIRLMAVSS